ncbi:hypothetical protein ACTMU2_14175 [Cupriavidus basilensis]
MKGELHPTDAGIELIEKLPAELRDPVTTAKWGDGTRAHCRRQDARHEF